MLDSKTFTNSGYTLVELLVVLVIFSTIGVLSTQAIANALRGANKSKNVSNIKTNLEYATSTMERLLRNAKSCTGSGNTLTYVDEEGATKYFGCVDNGSVGFIVLSDDSTVDASDPKLTNLSVNINSKCTIAAFTCTAGDKDLGLPDAIDITLVGSEVGVTGAEAASATVRTKVLLRSYYE